MRVRERTNLKMDNSEQDKKKIEGIQKKDNSEKGQFWKGKIKKTTTLNKNNLKKDNYKKEKSGKGQFWKGTI